MRPSLGRLSSSAGAHGDPATHFLEGDVLYPAVADRPSQAHELALIGLLRAAGARGYPIKVALVANVEDLALDPTMLRRPQRYAEFVAGQLQGGYPLRAPLLVVTPFGFGVAGLGGNERGVLAGLRVPPHAGGDALAAAATAAVRHLARAGGHPLPAHVAPAQFVYRGPTASDRRNWSGVKRFAIVFGLLFLLAWIAYELFVSRRRPDDPDSLDAPGTPGLGSHLSKRLDQLERHER